MLENENKMFRGVRAHRLTVVTQDDPAGGPITKGLKNNKGGGIDLLALTPTLRANLRNTANLHNAYEQLLEDAKYQGPARQQDTVERCKQGLRRTNADLPTEVQDPSHN